MKLISNNMECLDTQTKCPSSKPVELRNKIAENNNTRSTSDSSLLNKILLLTDDVGLGLNVKMRSNLINHHITSIVKPDAPLSAVIENLDKVATHFTKTDTIIIMAGKNDFSKNRYPSFKLICEKLKKFSHTNTILSSVPYTRNRIRNDRIYKYNTKLLVFITKLNRVTEGNVKFYEINNHRFKLSKSLISQDLTKLIVKNNFRAKSLIFVTPHESERSAEVFPHQGCAVNDNTVRSDMNSQSCQIVDFVLLEESTCTTDDGVLIEERAASAGHSSIIETDFLYPRLSQLSVVI